jgi:hypothetical protein
MSLERLLFRTAFEQVMLSGLTLDLIDTAGRKGSASGAEGLPRAARASCTSAIARGSS